MNMYVTCVQTTGAPIRPTILELELAFELSPACPLLALG